MDQSLLVALSIGAAATLYATAGQAGGTAFLAIMAFAAFPAEEMRPTALLLNIIAAGYATARLQWSEAIPWRTLWRVTAPSLGAAFLGGLLVLDAGVYFRATGVLLLAAALLTVVRHASEHDRRGKIPLLPAILVGTTAGFASGVTGVGGGIFLAPALIGLGWTTARQAAAISPPFILCNSALALAGVLISGQEPVAETPLYAAAAVGGAVLGTMIGTRWMSEGATRRVLCLILLFAGLRLLTRSG